MSDRVIELLQELIRNECVNDGKAASGFEERSVKTLAGFFGVEGHVFEPSPGRQSLVYRVNGTDSSAPSLALVPHLDVVPASAADWSVDPFSADIKDGFVYGRGALDMLNVVAAMAVAFKPYLTGEKTSKGDLVFCAVADEEGGGRFGAYRLVRDQWALVGADYLLTEIAYPGLPGQDVPHVPVSIGEKGSFFTKLKFVGTPGHGSAPYGTDNAVEKAVVALKGIIGTPSPSRVTDEWGEFAHCLGLDRETTAGLVDPGRLEEAIDTVAEIDPLLARYIHAATHLTIAANFVRGGDRANTIADRSTAVLDIRSLPGMDREFVDAHLREAMGSGSDDVDIVSLSNDESTTSSVGGSLWDAIAVGVEEIEGHRNIVPVLGTVATDARFWRQRGTISYGVGLYDSQTRFSELLSLFHGNDERVAIESVLRTTSLYERILKRF